MYKQMISRTTISMPVDLYQDYKIKAVRSERTLAEVIIEALRRERYVTDEMVEGELEETFAFFDRVAKNGRPIKNSAEVIRKMRDAQTKKLAGYLGR